MSASLPTVLLATSADLPDGEPGAAALDAALAERGIDAAWARWDDPEVDWAAADLVAVRSTWDYVTRHEAFVAWTQSLDQSRLLNGADVFAWNHDKRYLTDLGDLPVMDLEPAEMVEAVVQSVKALDPGTVPFLLGGDHTITVGAVRALAQRWPDLVVIQLDAHADLRETYEREPLSHACTMRRIWEILGDDRIVQLGVRSYTREEWRFARSHCRWSLDSLALPETVLAELRARPVYLTLDVDVLDPAFAPGVGNPEPGGPAFSDLCAALRALGRVRVVGMDVVEVSPLFDPAEITATAAAKLVRELILQFA